MPNPSHAKAATLEEEPLEAELVPVGNPNLPANVRDQDHQVLDLMPSDDAWVDVPDGDLTPGGATRIPYLSLNRKLGGGFVDPDTGEKTTEVDFIWLARGESRAWFKDAYGKGLDSPSCRSFDGITADPTSPDLQNGGDCTTCPLNTWDEAVERPCRASVEAMVFIHDPLGTGRLARIRWGGLAVGAARRFWESFATRIPRRPPIAYLSTATLEETETKNGTFLVPRFNRKAELSRVEAQPLIDERERRMADWKADIASDVATRTAAADEGDPFAKQDDGTAARTVPANEATGEEEF